MMKKTFCLFLALILVSVSLVSCGSGLSEEEVKGIVTELVTASYRINDIYFGEGLPHVNVEEEDTDVVYDVKPVKYAKVTTSEFTNIDDLKDAALKVYTEDYCEDIFKAAFEGLEDNEGNIFEYAKYILDLEYDLCVRSDLDSQSVVVGRTYDFSTLKIEKERKGYILFTLQSTVDGKDGGEVKLCIKEGSSGWRLDTPTY